MVISKDHERHDATSHQDDPDLPNTYWWKESKEQDLASKLDELVEEYHKYTLFSTLYSWQRITWRYYYDLSFEGSRFGEGLGIAFQGEQGEYLAMGLNHLRNLIQHRVNLTTKDRPALICRARNADTKSQRQAELGTGIIEAYLAEKELDKYWTKAVEYAIVLAEGFVVLTWDKVSGKPLDANEETGEIQYQGDINTHCPLSWNVIRDLGVRDWKKHQWIGVRHGVNKWLLAELFPEKREVILNGTLWNDLPRREEDQEIDQQEFYQQSDEIEVVDFWHLDNPALPGGRHNILVDTKLIFDAPMPYKTLPVHRIDGGEIMGTPHPYTPAFNLIAPQQALNSAVSTIVTNQDAFGVQSLYKKLGSKLKVTQVLGGMNLIEADEEPKAIQLTKTAAETFQFLQDLVRHMEIIFGVDQVSRGYTEQHIRSGAFAALLQAQSVSFAHGLNQSYVHLVEGVATSLLRMLREFTSEKRLVTIMGKQNRAYAKYFTGEDLSLIDRVTVEMSNPAFNTFAGKMQFAEMFAKTGMIKTPEEIINVFRTGNVDSMLEADRAQLNIIREENELIAEGKEVPPPRPEDNHVLHMREHASVFGTIEARANPQVNLAGNAHMMGHLKKMMADPNSQILQQILGYQAAPLAGAPPGNGAPGGNGNGKGTPMDITGAPTPTEAGLDGRSVANLPESSEAPPQF